MRTAFGFNELLEATEQLSLDEKEVFLEVLQKRTHEERRRQSKSEIAAARREYAGGKTKAMAPEQIMREILR